MFQGGLLRLGSGVVIDHINNLENVFYEAMWEGSEFGVEFGTYEGSLAFLIALFDRFLIRELTHGVSLEPRDPGSAAFLRAGGHQPLIVKAIPDVGFAEVWERTSQGDVALPPWPGATTAGGELFIEGEAGGRTLFLLIGDNAIARIYSDPGSSTDAIADQLSTLTLDWRAPTASQQ